MPVPVAGDAKRRLSAIAPSVVGGAAAFSINVVEKRSIFDGGFSIILRPHVTTKFFSRNFNRAGNSYSKG
ncbi:hypothetical protein CKQ53_06675 [Lonsdalea britannica]|uniref:Uncharacterized protein n=1 Tax=Lonsdalea britannica TaxID=1082704 RepID=A0AAD0WKC2_9GAMM|nr:hypothetical protein CKQ53_06675 [Lonsdalea britannica]